MINLQQQWHVIYTKPRTEKKTSAQLSNAGYEVFCPTFLDKRQWSDRVKTVEMVLFTSYVFLNITDKDFLNILKFDGVLRFVKYLGKPAVVKPEEILAIKDLLQAKNKIILTDDNKLNCQIVINNGPFINKTGTITKITKNKIKVFIESLNIEVELVKNKNEHK